MLMAGNLNKGSTSALGQPSPHRQEGADGDPEQLDGGLDLNPKP